MTSPNRDLDIIVVGAGLVGAVIASELASRGLKVAVVDSLEVASGATRRAFGLATPDLSPAHFAQTARGVGLVVQLAQQLGLTPRLMSVLHAASTPHGADALRRLAELHAGGPIQLSWETDLALPFAGAGEGLLVHNSAFIDPAILTVRLLQQPGIVVRPHFEILSLDSQGGEVVAMTSDNTVRAAAAVLAANAYTGLLSPYLADSARIVRGVVWRSRPKSRAEVSMPVWIDRGELIVGQTADLRMVVAAWDWRGERGAECPGRIHAYLEKNRPDLLNETETWSTTQTTVTPDGAPLVGALSTGRLSDARVVYALGAGPYGLAWAPIIAEQAAALVTHAGASSSS